MSGNNTRGPWLKDPTKPRPGETIGGGYFVFRRGDGTGRIRASQWPFEYASFEDARAQAEALAEQNSGYTFDVVAAVWSVPAAENASAEADNIDEIDMATAF